MLTDDQREIMKKNRLLNYESLIYELEMDKVAAEAVGETNVIERLQSEIDKMRLAYAAVEKM